MSISGLLTRLHSLNIRIWANGDQLQYSAPKGALTPELRDQLVQHKAALLKFFQEPTIFVGQAAEIEQAQGGSDASLPPPTRSYRYLFVLIEGGGTVPGLLGLAHRLLARGHAVWAIGDPCNEAEVRAAGCTFIPYRRAPHRLDKSAATVNFKDSSAKTPAEAIDLAADAFICRPAQAYAQDVLEAIERHPVDAVVVSELLLGGCFGAEKAGVPSTMIWWALYTLPYASEPIYGSIGWLSDQFARFMIERLDLYGLPRLQAARATLDLPPLTSVLAYLRQLDRILVTSSLAFDPEVRPFPNVRYIGPTIDTPGWVEEWESPWPPDHPDPLVVVAFSGTMLDQQAIVQRVIDALDGWPARGLVALGPLLDSSEFRVPANVVLRTSVWRKQVFPMAAVVVTHAGHMTVMQALSYGLPLICIPMGREQYGNATRVVAHGVGLRLAPTADVGAIRQAIQRVIGESGFRTRAAELGRSILADIRSAAGVIELEQLAERGYASRPSAG